MKGNKNNKYHNLLLALSQRELNKAHIDMETYRVLNEILRDLDLTRAQTNELINKANNILNPKP